ncbi:hypothetical protein SAMN05421740_11531 [Parapedobacter koreensis]|uniref:Uncharacterized protein n=1 Tax=Parapedobacter koreensis TaxID=332977 RepID=A0A1H7UH05_9SPHI|nr:hypothetical protein SAMN05421740_11531 [Parapedobacter koreensis]
MNNELFSFKKLFWSSVFGTSPFCILAGFFSLIGKIPIHFNEQPYYGIIGLIISIFLIPFISLVIGVTGWLFLNFGVVIYNAFMKIKK